MRGTSHQPSSGLLNVSVFGFFGHLEDVNFFNQHKFHSANNHFLSFHNFILQRGERFGWVPPTALRVLLVLHVVVVFLRLSFYGGGGGGSCRWE